MVYIMVYSVCVYTMVYTMIYIHMIYTMVYTMLLFHMLYTMVCTVAYSIICYITYLGIFQPRPAAIAAGDISWYKTYAIYHGTSPAAISSMIYTMLYSMVYTMLFTVDHSCSPPSHVHSNQGSLDSAQMVQMA
jgi:hypothetical protein